MKTILAIDSGVHACGVAYFNDGRLERAEYIRSGMIKPPLAVAARAMADVVLRWAGSSIFVVDEVVIELPQVYDRRHSKGDPNDLIALAVVCGAVAAQLADARFVLPKEWKGQIPKPKTGEVYIIEQRVKKRLSVEELRWVILPSAKSLRHNVFDAIGIGLWALGRM